jgi:cell division control protein 45
MLLVLDQWYVGYSQILSDCRQPTAESEGGASVLILVNANVDALASARILSYMLRADGVSYELRPCRSYQHLQEICASSLGNGLTYRALVLLNLGAHRNLTKLFGKESTDLSEETMKVYVMDCRRPVHLSNIHAGDNIVIFSDNLEDQQLPSDGDNLSGNESSSDEDDESSDDEEVEAEFEEDDDDDNEGENEFGKENEPLEVEKTGDVADKPAKDFDDDDSYDAEDEGETRAKRSKTTSAATTTTTEDSDATAATETQSTVPPTGEESSSLLPMTPRQLHEDRRNRLRAYYTSGSTYGSPAAFVAYKIATQLRFADLSDLLWLACVGVTDAYLHNRLDVAGYSQFAIFLRDCCQRLFPNDMYSRVGSAVYAEHLTNGGGSAEHLSRTKINFAGTGRILSETDFRFFLLRHSSLIDGMRYSEYCASKLGKDTLPKIHELLAKMGYPLTECHQPFALMKPSLRQRLRDQIRKFAPEYGLDNLEFTSFFRVTGYQSLLSASDTTYAVTALLESLDDPTTAESTEDERLQRAFHTAYEALNSYATPTTLRLHNANLNSLVSGAAGGGGGLATGLRLAMAMQRSILTTAASLVERNAITRLSHFRYAYVTCTSNASQEADSEWQPVTSKSASTADRVEDHIFAQPLVLSRLANYLMEIHRENGKWTGSRARPLILASELPRRQTYLVVGYEFPEAAGSVMANTFGNHFELAAQSMQGNFRFDSFDSNVVEVGGKDVQRFIEQLHYLLDSV